MTFKQYCDTHKDYQPKSNNIKDRFFYVYRITNIALNIHYYGSRMSILKPKDDLGKIYFSSSSNKSFMYEQHNNKSIFKYKIVRQCKDNREKILFESYLHDYFNVNKSEKFYNKCKATPSFFDVSGTRFKLNKESLEQRKKTMIERYGYPHSSSCPQIKWKIVRTNISKSKEEKESIKQRKLLSHKRYRDSLSIKDIKIINTNISKGTKLAMSKISPQKKKEMLNKYFQNKDFEKAGNAISLAFKNKTKEDFIVSSNKAKSTKLERYGDKNYNNQEQRKKTLEENWKKKSQKEKEKYKQECGRKISISKQGRNHHMTKQLIVLDKDNNPIYYFFGDAVKKCKELNLPYNLLNKTLKMNNNIDFNNKYQLANAIRNNQLPFKGWCMRKVEYVTS